MSFIEQNRSRPRHNMVALGPPVHWTAWSSATPDFGERPPELRIHLAQIELLHDRVRHAGIGAGLFSGAGLFAFYGVATLVASSGGTLDSVVTGHSFYNGELEVIEARATASGALRWRHELGPSNLGANQSVIGRCLFYLDLSTGTLNGLSTTTGDPELEIGLGFADAGSVGFMNAGNGLILMPFGSELIVVS